MARKTVLITGCSEGGLGDALAQAFHAQGYRVFATARNPTRMAHFAALGIETALLDVQSAESIAKCVAEISALTSGRLDMLVNNSGAGYNMPVADAALEASRELFELNFFAVVAVTQAFLPLILAAGPGATIVNNTSISAVVGLPLQGMYSASKAALSSLSDTLRLEMRPFGVKVVELRTGGVQSKFFANLKEKKDITKLPASSYYVAARTELEGFMSGDALDVNFQPANEWAKQVVGDLKAANPAQRIWRGGSAWLVWAGRAFFPHSAFDRMLAEKGGMDVVQAKLRTEQKSQ